MASLQMAVLVIIHQISLAGAAVTLTFDDNGYIGQSIVLQCKTNYSIVSPNGVWFFNGSLISSITTGGYSEIKTPDGFNLTISDLTTAHAGYYRCVIDFGSSSNKTLGILFNTIIEITDNPSTLQVTITIIAYPAPEYSVTLTKNGSLVTLTWTSTNITRPDGALKITLISTFKEMDYELTVDVTRPRPAFRRYFVKFAPPPNTPPPSAPPPSAPPPSGEPETPAKFHITDVQEKQVTLQWLSGEHRGFDQTFVIQVSMDNTTWTNDSLINAGKKEGWFSATVIGLKSNTAYYFRLYSFNLNGGSAFAAIDFATRTLKESASSLDIGASIGIGFGGFFLGVVGTISVIIVIWKRITARPKYSSTSEADMRTDMQAYVNAGVSSMPVPSHYEDLQQDRMEKTMYDHI